MSAILSKQVLNWVQVRWGRAPYGFFLFHTFTPRRGVLGCTRRSIVLHRKSAFLKDAGIFLYHCLKKVSQKKLTVGLGVDFEPIFNPKRSNQLIFNNTSPYQYPTSSLLEVKLCYWSHPSVHQESLSYNQSIKAWKNLSSDISWSRLDASAYMSCSVMSVFSLSYNGHVSKHWTSCTSRYSR